MSGNTNWQAAFGRPETVDALASIPPPARRPQPPARRDLVAVPDAGAAADPVEDELVEDGPVETEGPGGGGVADAVGGRAAFHADGIDAALASPPRATSEDPAPGQDAPAIVRPEPSPASARAEDSGHVAVVRPDSGGSRRSRSAAAPVPGRRSGERLSAAQLRARRVSHRHSDAVVQVLRAGGVEPRVRSATVVDGQVAVVLECPDAGVDALLDAVADGFSGQDVEVEIGRGTVTLFVTVVDDEPAKQRSVWVPAALRERVRAHTAQTGESVSQLAMRAFNAFHDQVGDAFTPGESTEGPLRVATTKRRSGVETPVTLWLYWQRAHEEEIDATVRLVGAGSRSALMTVLLERYLDSVGS